MSTLHFLSPFLNFLILVTSSTNSSTPAQINGTVTDELIRGICIHTRNPSLCLNNLKSLRGKSLLPNPVAALGRNSMYMVLSRANRTVALTWAHYRGTTIHKPEVRMKYYKCFLKYRDIMKQLRQANKYMLAGAPESVKDYVLVSVNQVNSCNQQLLRPPRERSDVLEANIELKDLCSIILAIFLTSSINSPALAAKDKNAVITDELIHTICSQTRKPSLCQNNLKSSKGKSLKPNSIAALGSSSMNMALHHANATADMIWRRYTATPTDKPEIRTKYHNCFMKYKIDVMNQLTKANECMLVGAARSVKNCIKVAVNRVYSCNKELMKPPREQSGSILEANDKLKDICSIILAICNKVPK
ncbi:UNVERIFIED_CONTAM: hypothetical protein Slati_4384400 [Sesamum latifolium]|uniref:Pectinesterase inhibitor domain-containing protein n=1 Tax=Sesamum latifolium TaxID=2727402 RepID=A0AAW2SPL1_9LAMI